MKNGLIGALVGALLIGAITYWLWARPLQDARIAAQSSTERIEELETSVADAVAKLAKPPKPRFATITLSKSATSRCQATINSDHIGGNPDEEIGWYVVDDESSKCNPSGG